MPTKPFNMKNLLLFKKYRILKERRRGTDIYNGRSITSINLVGGFVVILLLRNKYVSMGKTLLMFSAGLMIIIRHLVIPLIPFSSIGALIFNLTRHDLIFVKCVCYAYNDFRPAKTYIFGKSTYFSKSKINLYGQIFISIFKFYFY